MLENACFTSMLLLIRSRHNIGSYPAHTTFNGNAHNASAKGAHVVLEANTASDGTKITSEKEHRWRAIPVLILLDGMYFDLRRSLSHCSTIIFQQHYDKTNIGYITRSVLWLFISHLNSM